MDQFVDGESDITDAIAVGKQEQGNHRAEDNSECSTAPGSPEMRAVEPPLTPVSDDEDSKPGAVIIFDWDDTLLPTTALTDKASKKKWASAEALKKHAQLVEKTLRSASKIGRVSIVTLSRSGWVYSSAEKYLCDLNFPALVDELNITIYHAFEWANDYEWEAEDYVAIKQRAMVQCLKDLCSSDATLNSCVRLNALSIGDGEAEKWALKGIKGHRVKRAGFSSQRPLYKTLKLMDSPTVDQLSQELRALIRGMPSLVSRESRFDLTISKPAQLASKIYGVGL